MVPNGWIATQFGELADFRSGGTPSKQNAAYWGGEEPWISGKDLKSHYLHKSIDKLTTEGFNIAKKAPSGASLILVRGMTLLKDFPVGYATREVAFNQDIKALLAKADVDGLFLSFLLAGNKHKIKNLVTTAGHGTGRLDTDSLKEFPVDLPQLPEQRKIAKILSTWDKAIATTEKLIEASKQQKKSLMQQLLTGKKRLVNPETGKVFEGEWEEVPLSNWLIEFKEKSSIQDQHRVYTSSRAGLIPQDEYFGNSRISDRKNIGFHVLPPQYMTYRSRSDDGFFTFNLFKGKENGIISHYYPVFTTKGSNAFFIALLEQHRNVFGKHSVGTSQKVLSFNALKAIRFFVPSTDEQQKIASVLTAADKEIEVLEEKLSHFKQEKKALMQQLLTGKRRVAVE
ncbi:restriction endonuclease subunit S [Vibrio owensii]|uniref:restriction endonuclease subunit S n=1 Tax=Vibrio owensii TaxID=696485 RepID=UPI004068D8C4